ncbi:hypothetical protein D9611_012635 [Ephemerocybe angulata]|uniref:Uncharacterized protein n=1 Tax=Ephemerocybe angulata TaxID=980116 RepID=A0A8H5AUX4_9AGAR|nr:hypothetical protein D9611_012635 [Tulosesus angulatus]
MLSSNSAPKCPCCTIPVDLIIQSSDKQLFGGHTSVVTAQGLKQEQTHRDTRGKSLIVLDEPGYIVQTLLRLLHSDGLPRSPDELLEMDASHLVSLACAAEKYGVSTVASACKDVIRARVADMPWYALRYSLDCNHVDILDLAAPLTIGRLPSNSKGRPDHLDILGSNQQWQLAWYTYREQYLHLIDAVLRQPPPHKNAKHKLHDCGAWAPYRDAVLHDLPYTPLFDILSEMAEHGADTVFPRSSWEKDIIPPGWEPHECETCLQRAAKWRDDVSRRFRKLEPLSKVLERMGGG